MIKKVLKLEKGSGETPRETVGKLSQANLEKIAKEKMDDLNTDDIESAKRIVAGTAKSMGVEIKNG
jgi:large subunit ribosomal protein L11